jgi:two-component system sensor histidine kinase GlrK
LIQEWIRPFRIVGKDKNVKVEFCPPTSGTVVARIDPVKFPWVISNLLSNAIRFSPPGGTVEVCLESDDGLVRIEVLDEGPGIAEEDQSRMFDAFYQGHQAVETGKHGMFGIGLTIAKEVVEAHGGTIGYHGRSPHGSAFAIVLPAKG